MTENTTEKVTTGDIPGTIGSGSTQINPLISDLPPGQGEGSIASTGTLLGVVQPPQAEDKAPTPTRVAILREAASLITGDRQKEYGSPEVNFQRIASIWNVLAPGHEFKPRDVALLMAGLKLARAAEGYKRDSAVDAAGYLGIYAELSELFEESRNND